MTLTVGSLFSGVGGLEFGMEMTGGFKTSWQVEYDEFARKVLAKHWPDVPRHKDVRDVGRHNLEPVDLICGGFPCQNISSANTAGTRHGLAGEQSGLWREFARIVEETRPAWVVVENSPRWRDWVPAVRSDLWTLGYSSLPLLLRASDFGALHERPRVFVLAHADLHGEPLRAIHEEASRYAPIPRTRGHWRHTPAGVFRVANGFPYRTHRLRAAGNAVVPQVAQFVGTMILQAAERGDA